MEDQLLHPSFCESPILWNENPLLDATNKVTTRRSSTDSFLSLSVEKKTQNRSAGKENLEEVSSSKESVLNQSFIKEARKKFTRSITIEVEKENRPIIALPTSKKSVVKKLLPELKIEEPLQISCLEDPILSTKILEDLGVDVMEGEATFQDFEAFLIQKGMKASYEKEKIHTEDSPSTTTSKRLFNRDAIVASGTSGTTFEIHSEKNVPLIYKAEKYPKLLTNPQNRDHKFWEHGDLSAAVLNLPHLVKTISYFLSVKLPDGRHGKFYIPAESVQAFARQLPADAEVNLEGQLMEKAEGETIANLLKKGEISFDPNDPAGHFHSVVIALNEFLTTAYTYNFIHRDLKPENIFYHPVSRKITIIDTGEASYLGIKNNLDRITSTKKQGTRNIMAPAMFQGNAYGSEADFFSAVMLLFRLLNSQEFERFNNNRIAAGVTDPFFMEDSRNFLSIYLNNLQFSNEAFKDESTTTVRAIRSPMIESRSTRELLEEHPEIKEVIDLYFQASTGGTLKEQEISKNALAKLNQIPYLKTIATP